MSDFVPRDAGDNAARLGSADRGEASVLDAIRVRQEDLDAVAIRLT